MISKVDFQAGINRLFRSFNKPDPKPEAMAALYAVCPSWMTVESFEAGISRICENDDQLPSNIMRAIKARCHQSPSDQEFKGKSDFLPEEAARNRNRLRALLSVHGRGDGQRDELVALSSVYLLRRQELPGDEHTARSCAPKVRERMEEIFKSMDQLQVLDGVVAVLDRECDRLTAAGYGPVEDAKMPEEVRA